MSSFRTYLAVFLVLVAGLAFGAYLLNVPPAWIAVGVVLAVVLALAAVSFRAKPTGPV
jgi:hypothetical protein